MRYLHPPEIRHRDRQITVLQSHRNHIAELSLRDIGRHGMQRTILHKSSGGAKYIYHEVKYYRNRKQERKRYKRIF